MAASVGRALALLQTSEFEALVVDESLVEIDDGAIDALLNHAGLAMPIYINLGLHRTERVVRAVHAGLMRKQAEHLGAKRCAEKLLLRPTRIQRFERRMSLTSHVIFVAWTSGTSKVV